MRVGMSGVPICLWLGLRSSNGREQNAHLILIKQRLPQPRRLLPLLPLSPLSIFNNAGRCYSPSFLLAHDEDHKAWSPFFKSTFFVFLPFPALTFSHTSRTPSTSSQLSLFLSNSQHTSNSFGPSQIPFPRASPDPPSTALFEILSPLLFIRIASLVMKLPQISLLSNSPNPIVGQTLENPHE
jgi:hypothetical protein